MNGWRITIGIIAIAALAGVIYLVCTRRSSSSQVGLALGPRKASNTYQNREEIELLDFDKETFMPRRIVIHRHAEVS